MTKSIKLFGKRIISEYDHYIMSVTQNNNNNMSHLVLERVTDSYDRMINATYSKNIAKKIVDSNKDKCDVFIFKDKNNCVVGTVSVMYKGGNELEYKVRNIDAFIYNVFTGEKYRGNGYAGEMIKLLMDYVYDNSNHKIKEFNLAVSKNNLSALHAYKKIGFTIIKESKFYRVLKINIPQKVL